MTDKKFRSTINRNEILKNLGTKFSEIGSFLVWQKYPDSDTRSISTEVKFDAINLKYNFFSIILSEQDIDKIKKDTDTYFLLKDYDFAFKTRLIFISPTDPRVLQFKIPRDIHLKELRTHPRRTIEDQEKATITVVFKDRTVGKPIQTICPVLNISQTGISIMVSGDTVKKVNTEIPVDLEPITKFPELPFPTMAKIKNIRLLAKKSLVKDALYAIGLEFISHGAA